VKVNEDLMKFKVGVIFTMFLLFGCSSLDYSQGNIVCESYPLGGGLHRITVAGNAFAEPGDVRAEAYRRAGLITKNSGMDHFYIIEDLASVKTSYFNYGSKETGPLYWPVNKPQFTIIIKPTNNSDGIKV